MQKFQEPSSPTKHEKQLRFAEMKMIRQHILEIRERKPLIPILPDPPIVQSFQNMYKHKYLEIKKRSIQKSIEQKKKLYNLLKEEYNKYQQKYIEKQKSLKEKEQLTKILTEKLQNQYEKTKSHFREVGFNRAITLGVKKINYYRLGELLFNPVAKGVFHAITANYDQKQSSLKSSDLRQSSYPITNSVINFSQQRISNIRNQQELGICLGYLGLLITKVGEIAGARIWIQFTFRGSKSTIKLNDGSTLVLRPRQNRYFEGICLLCEQLHQIMQYNLGIKIQKSNNLYHMCEQLSHVLLS